MEEKQIGDELASIRSLMERSSKFISLSGLSGILAGVYALIGAAFAYHFIYNTLPELNPYDRINKNIPLTGYFYKNGDYYFAASYLVQTLISTSIIVLVASLVTGILLTLRKAKSKNQPIWGSVSKALLFNMVVPFTTGAILVLILISYGYYGLIAPTSLIFYGLALVSASNFTFTMVKYLGICEIILGLIASCIPGYGLLFWAIGFGVLHIVYGSIMYLKYDK